MRPGCRDMGVELEGAVVTAEDTQVREPSSEGQGFTVASVELSIWSRLPPCRDPCLDFRSPGPGAEKDTEKWVAKILYQGKATTLRPRSRSSRAHGPQGQKLGCVSHRSWPNGRTQLQALHHDSPQQLGKNKRAQEANRNDGSPTC